MEWTPLKTTLPPHSGWYEVKTRIQMDMFEDVEVTRQKSIMTAWYDGAAKTFRESDAKKSKQVLHVDSWRKVENAKTSEL